MYKAGDSSLSARDLNACLEVAEAYRRGQLGGRTSGGNSAGAQVVKVKNNSGAARRKGDILAFTGLALNDDQLAQNMLWFTGGEPSENTAAFGIVVDPILPNGKIGVCQVAGACPALVNVTNANHNFAVPVFGSYVLQSWWEGPVGILYKPPGTGEKGCAVTFTTMSKVSVVQVWKTTGSPQVGDLHQSATGEFEGRVLYKEGASWVPQYECCIAFTGYWGDDPTEVVAEHGKVLLGRWAGMTTHNDDPCPLYLCELGDQEFLGKRGSSTSKGGSGAFDIYHRSEVDSGIDITAKALGHEIPANKWAIVARLRGGQWYASKYES